MNEPSLGLDERVLSTLQGLRGHVAFSGLRRVLHAHPESLSRSLRRLEREGRVERVDGGYRLLDAARDPSSPQAAQLRPIAQVDLPPGASSEAIFGRLTGRWFGSLRWMGVVDGPSGRLLAWGRRDGLGYVLLGIRRGVLRVYVRPTDSVGDDSDAEDSAYELLTHALDVLRPAGHETRSSVTFLARAPSDAGPSFDNN